MLLETVRSLLVNELAEAPLPNSTEFQQYMPGHLFLKQEGPLLVHSFLVCLSFVFIHHHFFIILFFLSLEEQRVSNYLRAIHYR